MNAASQALDLTARAATSTSGVTIDRARLLSMVAQNLSARHIASEPIASSSAPAINTGTVSRSQKTGSVAFLPQYEMPQIPRYSFTAVQEWEGTVESVDEEKLTARLVDVTGGIAKSEEELAVIPLVEVQESDMELVRNGAVFRLAVGYQKSGTGNHKRIANLVFRRLPLWTRKDLVEADAAAERTLNAIRLE